MRVLPEIWYWDERPDWWTPIEGLVERPMVRPRARHFADPGDSLEKALEDATEYANSMVSQLSRHEDPAEVVLCLWGLADQEGSGVTVDHLFPYWAIAARRVTERLLVFAKGSDWPRAVVVHAEDRTDGTREERDQRLDLILGRHLRHLMPDDRILTGYGIRHAESFQASATSYGSPARTVENYEREQAGPYPHVAWVPGAGFLRRSDLELEPESVRRTTAIDVAGYLWHAVSAGCPAVILWTDADSQGDDDWEETRRALELLVAVGATLVEAGP